MCAGAHGGCTRCHACWLSYYLRPSHSYNAGTEHVGFSNETDIACTKRKAPWADGGPEGGRGAGEALGSASNTVFPPYVRGLS